MYDVGHSKNAEDFINHEEILGKHLPNADENKHNAAL